MLRLRGKGLPEFGGRHQGDLMVRLEAQVPRSLSRQEKDLYERLRGLGKTSGDRSG